VKVVAKDEALLEAKRNYGYFALVRNEIKEPVLALEIYRNKDRVEKAFDNLKERLNLPRMAVSSEQSFDGKLFVQFVALIFVSSLMKRMQENKLFKDYTMQEVLDELDLIECFEVPGQKLQLGETTKRQMGLYTKLGITPSSLQ
jgi:transposase